MSNLPSSCQPQSSNAKSTSPPAPPVARPMDQQADPVSSPRQSSASSLSRSLNQDLVPDGWADPINSVELGPESSPPDSPLVHARKDTNNSYKEAALDSPEWTEDMQGDDIIADKYPDTSDSDGPLLDLDGEQRDWTPEHIKRVHLDTVRSFDDRITKMGNSAKWEAKKERYLNHCRVLYGLDRDPDLAEELLPGSYPCAPGFQPEDYDPEEQSPLLAKRHELQRKTSSRALREEQGDDAEDTMNLPPSYIAPSHVPDDLQNILEGNRKPSQSETDVLTRHRQELEAVVEHDAEVSIMASGPSLSHLQDQAGAVALAPGVVVVDPEELDKLLSSDAGLVEYGSGAVPAKQTATTPAFLVRSTTEDVLRGVYEDYEDLPETPKSPTPASASPQLFSKQTPKSRERSKTLDSDRPTSSRRVSFADRAVVIDTPFTSTLKHFKSFNAPHVDTSPRGKENTPYKPRRKASLPEEIAELNREANYSDDDLAELEQYREMDLAPLDPVMEADTAGDLIAGDLIMEHSPSPRDFKRGKKNIDAFALRKTSHMADIPWPQTTAKLMRYEIPVPGQDAAYRLKFETNSRTSSADIAEFIRERATQNNAKEKEIEEAVSVSGFLDEPESFVVINNDSGEATNGHGDATSGHKKAVTGHDDEHPVFINVISMLPMALFWTAMRPMAYYSNKAYNAMLARLGNFTL